MRYVPSFLRASTTGLLQGLCELTILSVSSRLSICWLIVSCLCGGMQQGACLAGCASPVLILCSTRSVFPKCELEVAIGPGIHLLTRGRWSLVPKRLYPSCNLLTFRGCSLLPCC